LSKSSKAGLLFPVGRIFGQLFDKKRSDDWPRQEAVKGLESRRRNRRMWLSHQ